MKEQMREVELIEANKLCTLSRVKWLDVGDEPYAMFFVRLLKAKQQQESMHMLLKDGNKTVENKNEIMHEITRFCRDLF